MIGLGGIGGSVGVEIILMLMESDRPGDPAKEALRYKRGDVVEVLPITAHDWNFVANPIEDPWLLVKVVGIPKAIAMKYLGETKTGFAMTRRRQYGIVLTDLPAANQTSLQNTRATVILWDTLRLAMKHKDTGNAEP